VKIKSCGQRLDFLRKKLWAGDQQAMAKDLGVSQATISRVTRDERSLPLKLLQTVARDTQINLRWLLIGKGEPFLPQDHAEHGPVLPVVERPLPGPPDEHFLEIKGVYPVARGQFGAGRYWLCVTDRLVKEFRLKKVLAGDRILIDTAAASLAGPAAIFVVIPTATSKPRIQEKRSTPQRKHGSGRNLRGVRLRGLSQASGGKDVSNTSQSPDNEFPQVVGVAVLLERSFGEV